MIFKRNSFKNGSDISTQKTWLIWMIELIYDKIKLKSTASKQFNLISFNFIITFVAYGHERMRKKNRLRNRKKWKMFAGYF